MSLLSSKMLEPYMCDDGSIALVAVHEGSIKEVHATDVYGEKAVKDEVAIFEDYMEPRWPLPHNIVTDWERDLKSLSDIETSIMRYLRKYVYLRDERQYTLIANWVISTYFRDQFYYAPLLIIDGITVAGKSTLMHALSLVSYRGEMFYSSSGPSIAREIEDYGSTMLLDEVLDGLSTDRGMDLYTMMKSAFTRDGVWIRADPKGRKNFRYRTYTHIALSIRGDTLPEDVYNRSIRINMTAAPSHLEMGDIANWREDDVGEENSPDTIRTALYRLKAYSTAYPAESKLPIAGKSIDFRKYRMEARRDVTAKTEKGVWMYAYVNGLPEDSPAIRARDRNIANTLYATSLATGSGTDVIALIVDNASSQREGILDTPEALTFLSLLDLVDEGWRHGQWNEVMDTGLFCRLVRDISTTQIAQRFNEILTDQGNAEREPVATKTITAKLNAMGLTYSRTGGRGGNKSWMVPEDEYFTGLFLRYLRTYCPDRYADYKGLAVNKSE